MPVTFEEIKGDLFSCDQNCCLAHCVSKDLSMNKGIATEFRDRFGNINKLRAQNPDVGGCVYLKQDDRLIFYLVTKQKYSDKPTMRSLESSLIAMRNICVEEKVQHLAMPRIGCGLDRLDWRRVSELIQQVFLDTDLTITIYSI